MSDSEKCSLCPKVGKIFYKAEVQKDSCKKEIGLCGKCVNEIISPLIQEEDVLSPTLLSSLLKKDQGLQLAVQKNILNKYDVESETVKLQSEAMSPKKIRSKLNESIIGQDDATKVVSLAINRSYLAKSDQKISKTNVLLAGPTGVGKTQIARVASQILNCPLVIVDCSSITSSGYIGENIDSIFSRLLKKADNDMSRAQNGIVILDEFDKIVKNYNNGEESVVSIQNELLQVIADGDYTFQTEKNGPVKIISTRNILFIACGAFSKIRANKAEKMKKSSINLSSKKTDSIPAHSQEITLDDIEKYGIKSELLGRFAYFSDLKQLNEEDLVKILVDKKDSLDQEYRKIFNQNGSSYEPSRAFYKSVAQEALKLGFGARGLKQVLENRLKDYIFDGSDFITEGDPVHGTECGKGN